MIITNTLFLENLYTVYIPQMGYIPQKGYPFKVIHVYPDLEPGSAKGAENSHICAFWHNITVQPHFIRVKLQS
jgi:hypothetical protein